MVVFAAMKTEVGTDRTAKKITSALLSCAIVGSLCFLPSARAADGAATGEEISGLSSAQEPIKDKWALVVGISKFKDNSLNLKFPAKDATDFYNYLISDGKFAKDHVKLLINENATRANILEQLGDKWLPRAAMPGDLVVIYLSTHGSPSEMDVGGVNYIVAHDTDKDSLYASGIAMQDLCRIVKARVHSDRTLIIMDACHSGATSPDGKGISRPANVDAEAIAQGTGQMVICSSLPNQTSWESQNAQNSVFTKRLLEALRVKGSDTPIGDAFSYLKDKVQADVLRERGELQTPILKSKWAGSDLRLAAIPVDPRPTIDTHDEPTAVEKISTRPGPPKTASVPISSVAPVKPQLKATPPVSVTSSDPAEKALRDHFVRMAYGSPQEAYDDFTESIKKTTPFARYSINVRKQHYVPAVSNMPPQAFKRMSANGDHAVILVNEKWITGEPLLWRYALVKSGGVWLIDGFKKITAADWH